MAIAGRPAKNREKYEIEEEKSGPRGKAITGEKKLLP